MEWLHEQDRFWDKYSQEFRCTLWGVEAWFDIAYYNDGRACGERLAQFAEAADHCLGWLNTHQAEIFAAIEADGLYEDAREVIEELRDEDNCQMIEEDGISFLLADGRGRFPLPYQKADFFSSLVPGGLSFSADHKSTEFTLDMFLGTEPEIFAGHSIEVFLDGDFAAEPPVYSITVNGLAG